MASDVSTRLPRFFLGMIIITPAALRAMEQAERNPVELLAKHQYGDEETVDEGHSFNEYAAQRGERVFSKHEMATGETIWIVTEASRVSTTMMLPSEY
jgi:hypothetical protein